MGCSRGPEEEEETAKSAGKASDRVSRTPAGDPLLRLDAASQTRVDAIQAAYQGTVVGQAYEANRVFNVAVILAPVVRQDPEAVGSLMLQNAEGVRVPLRGLADIYETTGRYSIAHEGTRRRQAVFCNVKGRDLASFVEEIRRTIQSKVRFPAGVYAVVGGASEALGQAQREILTYSLIAGTGVILLLSIAFHNVRNMLLVLANLPFALVGCTTYLVTDACERE
jgi:Cu/Ag efflux pump CusA